MIVYFAEPLDHDKGRLGDAPYRDLLVKNIQELGGTVYRPGTAWSLNPHISPEQFPSVSRKVEGVNRAALDRADLLVARLPEGVPSQGVPMEIEYATRTLGIPVIVVGVGGVSFAANPLITVIASHAFDEFTKTFIKLSRMDRKDPNILYHTGALKPRSYDTDAGIDLVTSVTTTIAPYGHGMVPTGNRIQIPKGTFAWVVARSSCFKNTGLIVLPGIIDEGYTGELMAAVHNTTDQPVTVKVGVRLCQVVFFDNVTARYIPQQVDQVESGPRGDNGFGSTGGTASAVA